MTDLELEEDLELEDDETAIGDARIPQLDGHNPALGPPPELHGISAAGWRARERERLGPVMERAKAVMPEPEVRATVLELDDPRIRSTLKTFVNTAVKAGWAVRVSYARGPLLSDLSQCSICGGMVKVKVDGGLFAHKVGDDPCDGVVVPDSAEMKIVNSIQVRCRRGHFTALATWIDGRASKPDTWLHNPGDGPRQVGVTEAQKHLLEEHW